jgi:phosphoglycolate phosphatase-like HAD superfamily hydrolase
MQGSAEYPASVGIFDFLLEALGPKARKELAKEAAKQAVKQAGDAIYAKADEAREQIESSIRAQREAREREEAARQRERQKARDAAQIEDELAALKAKVRRDDR